MSEWILTSGKYAGKKIVLLTPRQLKAAQKTNPNKILVSIRGTRHRASTCDDYDTRFGYTAFGNIPAKNGGNKK